MIGEVPMLTIRRNFPRPEAKLLAGFAGAQTAHVADAMSGRGALDFRIKPVFPVTGTIVGTAVTSENGPADNLAVMAALAIAKAGDVLVAATDNFTGVALVGDLFMGLARNCGMAAMVTDGMVRDVAGIQAAGVPAYAAGVTPNSPAGNGPGSVGLPVVIGGVAVESGDIIVADPDGVVVVPLKRAAEVLSALAEVQAAEAALDAKVKAGLTIYDSVRAILASGRVREIG